VLLGVGTLGAENGVTSAARFAIPVGGLATSVVPNQPFHEEHPGRARRVLRAGAMVGLVSVLAILLIVALRTQGDKRQLATNETGFVPATTESEPATSASQAPIDAVCTRSTAWFPDLPSIGGPSSTSTAEDATTEYFQAVAIEFNASTISSLRYSPELKPFARGPQLREDGMVELGFETSAGEQGTSYLRNAGDGWELVAIVSDNVSIPEIEANGQRISGIATSSTAEDLYVGLFESRALGDGASQRNGLSGPGLHELEFDLAANSQFVRLRAFTLASNGTVISFTEIPICQ